VRLRGTIVSLDGSTLTVKTREGPTSAVALNPGWKVGGVSIPDGIPIVTLGPATAADLKPGATVFVPAQRGDDGSLSTGRVVVGANGVVPPM
jgi:hypothetical protein